MNISSIYMHVPFCRHLCNYCDFFKYAVDDPRAPSWNAFEVQIQKQMNTLKKKSFELGFEIAPLKTFYMGGGTPSLWGRRGIDYLSNFFHKNSLNFHQDYQWTLEVDPDAMTYSELKDWIKLGVNRFSLGIQSIDSNYLKIADRQHTAKQVLSLIEWMKHEKQAFSLDFLLSLPSINLPQRNIIQELKTVLPYQPSHLSLYILTVGKAYNHYSQMPSDSWTQREYLKMSEFLQSMGYQHYEVSNFCLPNQYSKHNFIYWEGQSYLGLGPSSTGQWRLSSKQMLRYHWSATNKWIAEKLNKKELDLENLYLGMRTKKGIKKTNIKPELAKVWLDAGLISSRNNSYCLTPRGFLIIDSLIHQLF